MDKSMSSEITISLESFITLVASELGIVGVRQEVHLEAGPLVERLATGRTLVRRGVHVEDLVNREGPRLTEAFPTIRTLERFVFGMNVSVVSQMVLPPESFPAYITIEGTLVGVGSLVDQQVVRLAELSLAVLADVPLLWLSRRTLTRRSRLGRCSQFHFVWLHCRRGLFGQNFVRFMFKFVWICRFLC